jgi:hypothetical protein
MMLTDTAGMDLKEPMMTAGQLRHAMRELGLSERQLADNLGLSPQNGHVTVRRMKNDEIPVSGPIATSIAAFLSGWRPAWYRD